MEEERENPQQRRENKRKQVEQVECGSEHSVAVTSSGQCWTWGCNQGRSLMRIGRVGAFGA